MMSSNMSKEIVNNILDILIDNVGSCYCGRYSRDEVKEALIIAQENLVKKNEEYN